MRKTLLLCVAGVCIIALGVVVDRARGKPAMKTQAKLRILSNESPQPVADRSPASAQPGETVKVATPAPASALRGDALSERQAALKLILEDFRAEQARAAQRGESVDRELTKATAKLFIQMSGEQSSDNVVKLLAEMTTEHAAKVLAEIAVTEAELAESLRLKLEARHE